MEQKEYLSADDIKIRLLDYLTQKNKNAVFANEVLFSQNKRRADLVRLLNKTLTAFEIKGDLDNTSKLRKQISDAIFAKYESQLCKLIEKTNTKNAYDIQVESFKIIKENLLNMLDEKELIAIKDEAYDRGIIIDDVIAIFGVLLRNCILQKKGIPIADVDKHEPQNPK
jgi:16S rRNA C967 or C1407 C5-methylase (RsmB/RsmF family)